MPRKPKQPCAYPGCPNLSNGRYCEQHRKLVEKNYEQYSRDPAVHKSTAEYGKGFVTAMLRRIPSARSVLSKASLFLWRRYIIRFPSPKAVLMTEAI